MYITYVEVCLHFQRVLKGSNFDLPYTKEVYSKLTLFHLCFKRMSFKGDNKKKF